MCHWLVQRGDPTLPRFTSTQFLFRNNSSPFSIMQAGNDIVPPAVGHGSRKKHKTAQPRQQKDQWNKKNRVKGKTGKLAGLLELPFDILLEVRLNLSHRPIGSCTLQRYSGIWCHWIYCIWHAPRSNSDVYLCTDHLCQFGCRLVRMWWASPIVLPVCQSRNLLTWSSTNIVMYVISYFSVFKS